MATYELIRAMLSGGDRRSLGRSGEVLRLMSTNPGSFGVLLKCLCDRNDVIRMRAADVIEKLSRNESHQLDSHKAELLVQFSKSRQQEVRWHLAVVLPRLRLSKRECVLVANTLQNYLEDRSSIVKASAMQGLADLTRQCVFLRPKAIRLIRASTIAGTAAMKARGRRLLKELVYAPTADANTVRPAMRKRLKN